MLSSDFPLNDGGLFYSMIEDLKRSDYVLPLVTSYNSADIPFAYSPLAFYVAGALTDATPLSLLDVLRFLPLATSTITIGAFFLLARSLLPSRAAVTAATLAFALLPNSFTWMIMGGGLTRSFGFLFAILALHQAHLLYTRRHKRLVLSTILFASLTVLSHTEMAWFLAFSAAVMFVAYGRNRDGVANSALVAAGVAAATAPWWATIIARHGVDPLLAAGGSRPIFSGYTLVRLIELNLTSEPLFPVIALVGVLGALTCVASRKYFLPAWLVLIMFPATWVLATFAVVPLALLVGIGFTEVLLPLLSKTGGLRTPLRTVMEGADDTHISRAKRPWLLTAGMVFIIGYSTFSALLVKSDLLVGLSAEERDAMQWTAEHTPQSSEFLVITSELWWRDRTSEWFPAMTKRASVVTAQGFEWVPNGGFQRQREAYEDAQACATADAACLEIWRRESGKTFTHVYVSKRTPQLLDRYGVENCCSALRYSLLNDPGYLMVYDGPAASIFAYLSP